MKKFYFVLLAALWMGAATTSAQSTGAYDATYDVNGDGKCNSVDMTVLVQYLVADHSYNSKYDVNGDGFCNADDVEALVAYLLTKDGNAHEYVDLGLPSGTLWATCNVGAASPEDYGLYFAWGETKGYTSDTSDGRSFDYASYKWMTPGQSSWTGCTKYSTEDGRTSGCWYSDGTYVGTTIDGKTYINLTKLEAADDAATANWGSLWSMPTQRQLYELIHPSYTSIEWTTVNGVYGSKITSLSNGNSIFMPAAGQRVDSGLYYAGADGYYWSNTLVDGAYGARLISFCSSGVGYYIARRHGHSVRPVLNTWSCNTEPELLLGSLTVSPSSLTLSVGEWADLTSSEWPWYADNKDVTWTSDNESVATCNKWTVYAKGEGTATITCAAKDASGLKATCVVTVTPKPTSNNLLPGYYSVSAAKQVQFTRSNLCYEGGEFKFEANQTDYPTDADSHQGHFFWYTNTTSGRFFADGSDADHMLTVEGTSDLYVLSSAEWDYLINSRASSLHKYPVTVTNDGTSYTNCLIIAPDDFTGSLKSSYTLDEVNANHLVCLPAAGVEQDIFSESPVFEEAGKLGLYWTSTPSPENDYEDFDLFFYDGNLYTDACMHWSVGGSLRLVKERIPK